MNEKSKAMSHQKDQTPTFFIISIFISFFVCPSTPLTDHHYCMNYTSSDHPIQCQLRGPEVRFPFRLKGRQPNRCGASPSGFDLSCSDDDDIPETLLHLPFSQTPFFVKAINYSSQTIDLSDPYGCNPSRLLHLDLSNSPFLHSTSTSSSDSISSVSYKVTFLKCSSGQPSYEDCDVYRIDCLSDDGMEIFASYDAQEESSSSSKFNILSSGCEKRTMLVAFKYSYSYIPLWDHPLSHCEKIKTTTFVPTGGTLDPNDKDWRIRLSWEKPDCRDCEVQGKGCRFKNRTPLVTECFNLIHVPHEGNNSGTPVLTGLIFGFSFLVLIILSAMKLFYIYNMDEVKNQVRIEKFLEDYKALNPTRYTYADLKRITNQFKFTIGEGAYGTVFKGRLSSEIEVAVKMLNSSQGNGEEFINEVSTISRIHHVNVVRLVGFCADGYRRALVYEFMPNESLEKYIFSKNNKGKSTSPSTSTSTSLFLGWQKLQDIAIGIAKGIEYLHQGCDHRIFHFDIKPQNILLDRNFNPKISDFGLAKLCSKGESFVSMSAARGTIGYIAPEVLSRNFGNVSYKSDVYSFGMLLLEMVGGRKNTDATVSASQVYFPEWAYKCLEQGREMGFIKVEREGDEEIAKRLTIVALWCIQWYPVDRPSMKVAVQMLEGQVESLTVPPNPFAAAGHQHASSSTNPKNNHPNGLTVIPEQEECD